MPCIVTDDLVVPCAGTCGVSLLRCTNLQVPRKLAKLVVQAQRRHPKTEAVRAAAEALQLFQVKSSAHVGRPGSKVALALRQQLQEAGFMPRLPALLTDAAEHLQAALSTGDQLTDCQLNALLQADHALDIRYYTYMLWPSKERSAVGAEAAPAALHLALTAYRSISLYSQQQQQQQCDSRHAATLEVYMRRSTSLLHTACMAVTEVAFAVPELLKQHHRSAVPADVLPALALMICVTVVALSKEQQPDAAGSAGEGSSSARDSSRNAQAAAAAAGDCSSSPGAASRQQPPASSQADSSRGVSLTPMTSKLFDLLGVTWATVQQAARGLVVTEDDALPLLINVYTSAVTKVSGGSISGRVSMQSRPHRVLSCILFNCTSAAQAVAAFSSTVVAPSRQHQPVCWLVGMTCH